MLLAAVGARAVRHALMGVLLHFQLLPVETLGLVLVLEDLLVHGVVVGLLACLRLAHVVDGPVCHASVRAKPAASLSDDVRGRLRVHLLLVRALWAHHASREVTHATMGVQAATRALWNHLPSALRFQILLLLVVLHLRCHRLLLQVHLLLQVRMHLHELALWCRPAVALAWMLALRLGSRLHLLLVCHLLLQDIRIVVHVLNVDDVRVLFVFIVIVVVCVSLVATHDITTRLHIVIHSLVGLAPFARHTDALCVALTIDREPLLLLQLLGVLPCDALGPARGRRSLLAARIAIGIGFKLRDAELRRQVEALIVSLVLLREELLPVVVEVLRERKIADYLGGIRLLR